MKNFKKLFILAVLCFSIGSFAAVSKADDPSDPPGTYVPTPTPSPTPCPPGEICGEGGGNRSSSTESGNNSDFWFWYYLTLLAKNVP